MAKPRVFISYAHDDREWARMLDQELATRGFDRFFDYNSLRAGQNWEDQLLDALTACGRTSAPASYAFASKMSGTA